MTESEILAAFRALPLHRRYEAMRVACSYALEVWERYAKSGDPIEYTDAVVGNRHVVDMALPIRAIEAVDAKLTGGHVDPKPIWTRYAEPISALQDGDLDLPENIARAYYAIYNLFGVVLSQTKLYDDGEIVIRQADTGEGFLEEWWTRAWDAWATRATASYEPTELDEPTFDAICSGDLDDALAKCKHDTRLHVTLLAIAARVDEAVAVASRLFGCDDLAWLRRAILHLGSNDAIAVSPDGTNYAVIYKRHYHVRRVADNQLSLDGKCSWDLRRVSFTANSKIVVFAGDSSDDIGLYQTIISGEELYSADYGYRVELPGARTIVALASTQIVVASETEVRVDRDSYGPGRVSGGALDDDYLATYAGTEFSLYNRANRRRLVGMDLGCDIWHVALAAGRLLVACRGRRAHLLVLA